MPVHYRIEHAIRVALLLLIALVLGLMLHASLLWGGSGAAPVSVFELALAAFLSSALLVWEWFAFFRRTPATPQSVDDDEARTRLAAIVESSQDAIIGKDFNGFITSWNPAAERIFGYTADDAIGQSLLILFPREREHEEREIIRRIRDGETVPAFDTVRVRKDGRQIDVSVSISPIVDQHGRIVGASKIARDITPQKLAGEALRRSEERYRTTLDNILEGCQLIGFDWEYLYLNDAAAIQNRRPNDELLGRRMPDMWPGIESSPVFTLLTRSLVSRVAAHEEIEFTFPDGSRAWFDVRSQPVPEGVFVLSIDISQRKLAERSLRKLNEQLENTVARRTQELEVALERAEEADKIKSSFLATMSHELRTPLNSILGFTGVILQGLAGPINAEQTKQLGMVRSSARHLLDLINDVLDISKIEAGAMDVTFKPFNLGDSIVHAGHIIEPMAQHKGLEFRVDVPAELPQMISDQRRVDQILINLLNNAVKFTERGTITTRVELVRKPSSSGSDQTFVSVHIRDSGMGIKREDLAVLFEPFRQLDSGTTRHHDGTGLGLAICRRLANLLGGDVRAESEIGKGSQFTVTLPLDARN
ncbi:MAG: PAS domain S-box protein [Rudaea sp.]